MNKSILMGRLTKDPELKYTSGNNTAVASFTLAVNRRFKQEGQPNADFINIVAWAKTAEFCGKYFTKGSQVAVVGRIQTRTWDDNEGKKHYVTEVVAEETYFADSKKSNNGTTPNTNTSQANGDGFYPMDEDDELPF
jgi:single-strand DNA-binding protein